MNPFVEEELVSTSVWPEISYLANMISDNYWSVDEGHNPRQEIWNDPICLVCQCVSEFTQMRKTTKPKTKHAFTPNKNEKKWWQPWFQLHLVTKFHSRWELGLVTSSAVVHLWKMMPCTMSRSIQILYEQQCIECFHFFVHGRLSFYYFHLVALVSSIILALQVCELILSYIVCNFCYHWRKIRNVWHQLMQISERQRAPVNNIFEFWGFAKS